MSRIRCAPPGARLLLGIWLLATFAAAPPAGADSCTSSVSCGFAACKTPADVVPEELWSGLSPVDVGGLPTGTSSLSGSRDTTWFDRNGGYTLAKPYWESLDVEAGWLFAGVNKGFQVWSLLLDPESPARASNTDVASLPFLAANPHDYFLVKDVDAPPGEDDLVAMTGWGAMGMVVWDTSDKSNPRVLYQDAGQSGEKFGEELYTTTIGGRHYAFMAARSFDGAGLWIYDLSRAVELGLPGPCVEERPTSVNPICSGVYVGKLSDDPKTHVDGAGDGADEHFVVASGGIYGGAGDGGFDIWDVSDPASPELVMSGLGADRVHGVALWRYAGRYYLGLVARYRDQGEIWDVSCIAQGPCSLPAQPLYRFPVVGLGASAIATVTDSEVSGSPFVYFGRRSGYALDDLQGEWLFDVSALPFGAPVELAGGDPNNGNLGQPTTVVTGTTVGYWSWYYSCHPSGSNFFTPVTGRFAGPYFYRAGSSILDIHRLEVEPIAAIFTDGFESGDVSAWSAAEGTAPPP